MPHQYCRPARRSQQEEQVPRALPVYRRQTQVYTLMGGLVFLATLCATARAGSVKASWQTGLELQVIVAVVLGGTQVSGGVANVTGSLWGVLIIAVFQEGLRGASQWQQSLPFKLSHVEYIMLGVLLVAGVWVNTYLSLRKQE